MLLGKPFSGICEFIDNLKLVVSITIAHDTSKMENYPYL